MGYIVCGGSEYEGDPSLRKDLVYVTRPTCKKKVKTKDPPGSRGAWFWLKAGHNEKNVSVL